MATTTLESTPPLRKAPTGTSLRSRIRTASSSSAWKRSGTSRGAGPSSGSGTSQYFLSAVLPGRHTR